jgi:hypothetical protein
LEDLASPRPEEHLQWGILCELERRGETSLITEDVLHSVIRTVVPRHQHVGHIGPCLELGKYWAERYDYLISLLGELGAEPTQSDYSFMMRTWAVLGYAPGALAIWYRVLDRGIAVDQTFLIRTILAFLRWTVLLRSGPHEAQPHVHLGVTVEKVLRESMVVVDYARDFGIENSVILNLSLRLLKEVGSIDDVRRALLAIHNLNLDLLDAPSSIQQGHSQPLPVRRFTVNLIMSMLSDRDDLSKMMSVYERFANPLPFSASLPEVSPPLSPALDDSASPSPSEEDGDVRRRQPKDEVEQYYANLGIYRSPERRALPPPNVTSRTLSFLIATALRLGHHAIANNYIAEAIRLAGLWRWYLIDQYADYLRWERDPPSDGRLPPFIPYLRVNINIKHLYPAFSSALRAHQYGGALTILNLTQRARQELARDYEAILDLDPDSSEPPKPKPLSAVLASRTPGLILPRQPEQHLRLVQNKDLPRNLVQDMAILARSLEELDAALPKMRAAVDRLRNLRAVRRWKSIVERAAASNAAPSVLARLRDGLNARMLLVSSTLPPPTPTGLSVSPEEKRRMRWRPSKEDVREPPESSLEEADMEEEDVPNFKLRPSRRIA